MSQRVTQEDIADILEAFGNSRFTHLELTVGSVRVAANRGSSAAEHDVDLIPGAALVVAPLLGMFQASPEPGAPAFVHPGTKVQADTTIGFIRVLQNSTAVKAGLCGTVVDVLVQDGQFVEFGQTLLRVSPEPDGGNAR